MTALLTTLGFQVLANITVNGNLSDQGYVKFPDVHAAYKIHEELATWNEARELCMAEGAHLAITDSLEKIEHVKSMRNQSDYWLHVGIYNVAHTDRWTRVDNGLPVASMAWAYGYPNRSGNCAGISIFQNGLIDYPCHGKQEYFVCEIQIAEENNGTESSDQDSDLAVTESTPQEYFATLPVGYVAYPDIGAAYKIVDANVNWIEARKRCFDEGAQLAEIGTRQKLNYIRSDLARNTYVHVGIHRLDDEWVSIISGAALQSIPWHSNEPKTLNDSNCVMAYRNGPGGFINRSCKAKKGDYVCELPNPMGTGNSKITIN